MGRKIRIFDTLYEAEIRMKNVLIELLLTLENEDTQ